ncbi:hypothetical protein GCM10022393_28470 [Aquimarina addita]|uniref:Lipoprotein n=1 Tax=Aquimarina addita TaxID=870485 RepID=A0ABP6URF6_9FLAO
MKNLFLFATILLLVSCSGDETNEQVLETSNLSFSTCDGYGVFDNVDYDCGWKRGYGDWVYHYNITVAQYNYDPCEEIRIVGTDGGIFTLYAGQTDASHAIIGLTQNNNQAYYDDLFDDLSTDYLKGKAAGYQWGRGQEPLAAADPDCFF